MADMSGFCREPCGWFLTADIYYPLDGLDGVFDQRYTSKLKARSKNVDSESWTRSEFGLRVEIILRSDRENLSAV